MVCTRQRRRTARRGATMVEFAFVVPIFFIFVFGMVDIGRGFMVQSLLHNAARVGCRTGVLQGKTTSDVTAAVASAVNIGGITNTTTTVSVNGTAGGQVANASTGDAISVRVTVPVADVTWLPGMTYLAGTIGAQYTLTHE
jgi:Flp pilus assembly protein TadG